MVTIADDTESRLLEDNADEGETHEIHTKVSLKELLVAPNLRRPLTVVCAAMMSQQLSGINAGVYHPK